MGYQKEHERYGGENYPAGTIVELSAKKMRQGDSGLFKFRYGKLDSDTPNSTDKGEILGIYAYEGLNVKGISVTDALAEGKGWGVNYKPNAEQSFIHSVGRAQKPEKSFERKLLKDQKDDFEYLGLYGGENSAKTLIKHKNLEFSRVLTPENYSKEVVFSDFALKETLDKQWSLQYEEGSSKDGIIVKKDHIQLKNDSTSEILVEEDVLSLKNKSGDKIEIEGGKISIKNKSGDTIELEKGEITLKSGPTTVKLDSKGFKVNGKALLFESFGKTITNTAAVAVSASPGSPAPLFPALKTQLSLPVHKTSV
jgi:hypothetical protein